MYIVQRTLALSHRTALVLCDWSAVRVTLVRKRLIGNEVILFGARCIRLRSSVRFSGFLSFRREDMKKNFSDFVILHTKQINIIAMI